MISRIELSDFKKLKINILKTAWRKLLIESIKVIISMFMFLIWVTDPTIVSDFQKCCRRSFNYPAFCNEKLQFLAYVRISVCIVSFPAQIGAFMGGLKILVFYCKVQ